MRRGLVGQSRLAGPFLIAAQNRWLSHQKEKAVKWITKARSAIGKRLNRAREKCPDIAIIKKVGKEVGREVRETVEIEAEEIVDSTKKVARWSRHNPIKVIVGIIASIFILK